MSAEEQKQCEEDVPKAAEAVVCTTAGWGSRPSPAHTERAQPGCQSGPGEGRGLGAAPELFHGNSVRPIF